MALIEDAAGVRGWLVGSILAFHHYGSITVDTARTVARINARAFATAPRLGVMVVLEPNLSVPDSESREVFSRAAKESEPHVAAMAHVVLGQGFAAATTRAVIAGLSAFTRLRHSQKVFATIPEAGRWLAPHIELAPASVADVVTRIEELVGSPR